MLTTMLTVQILYYICTYIELSCGYKYNYGHSECRRARVHFLCFHKASMDHELLYIDSLHREDPPSVSLMAATVPVYFLQSSDSRHRRLVLYSRHP